MESTTEVVQMWEAYFDTVTDWTNLIGAEEPEFGGCGWIYALPNPIERPNESFAIADMRSLDIAEPHYHSRGETEIYFVLQGLGKVVVSEAERDVSAGSVVVISPESAHFTIPHESLVLAVINTPPFDPENYIVLTDTTPAVGFDKTQFDRLRPKSIKPEELQYNSD